MFSAPEAPAPKAMNKIAVKNATGGICTGAAIMPAKAVNTTKDITRGLSNCTKSENPGSAASWPPKSPLDLMSVMALAFLELLTPKAPQGAPANFRRNALD